MDDMWLKIGSAILLGMMLVAIYPRARHMWENSPDAESGDWRAAVFPILLVIGFIVMLMWMV